MCSSGSGAAGSTFTTTKNPCRGNIHHFGIQTDDIAAVACTLKAGGIEFKKNIINLGIWKYLMIPAPDDVLIELFQVDKTKLPPEFVDYFE